MKNTTIFAAAAVISVGMLAASAFATLPANTAPVFGSGYATPKYWIDAGSVKQSLSVSGCKTISAPAKGAPALSTGNVVLFEDPAAGAASTTGSFVLYANFVGTDIDLTDFVALTGAWTKVPSSKSDTFYLTFNTASMGLLMDNLETAAFENCKIKKPALTEVKILDPSALISKNTIVMKVSNGIATGSLLIKAKEQSDQKTSNTFTTGSMKMKLTITGQLKAQ